MGTRYYRGTAPAGFISSFIFRNHRLQLKHCVQKILFFLPLFQLPDLLLQFLNRH